MNRVKKQRSGPDESLMLRVPLHLQKNGCKTKKDNDDSIESCLIDAVNFE